MNLFKFSLLGLFIFLLTIVTPHNSYALDANATSSTTVATVNIEDARIISQDGNSFDIAFTLTNREGLQTGVKYGIQLVKDGTNYIADEKVYDESVTLYENSNIKREITYVAPSQFGGDYTLYISSNNENGFPFGTALVGKAKLTSTQKSVSILNDSCYLQVEGEKGSPHYTLMQSVDISKSESLRLTCTATNNTDASMSMTPTFETRYFNAYGKIAPQAGGDFTAISFNKNEKKTFSLVIPKGNMPQFYDLKFSLANTDTSSNNISVHYIINGISATIQKISLDKDYYNSGDSAQISMLWSVSTGNFTRNHTSSSVPPKVLFNATITNDKGIECASPINQTLVKSSQIPQTVIPFKLTATCLNPHVSATLTDEQGNTLDQKDFVFQSNPAGITKSSSPLSTTIIIIALLVIIGVAVSIKKRKNSLNSVPQ